MMHYRFIAAPADKTKQQTLEKLKSVIATGPNDLAEVYSFDVPELKVGTLDSLVVCAEDLSRTDQLVEATVNKVIEHIRGLVDGNAAQLSQSLTVNDRSVDNAIRNFKWNSKYRLDRSVKELSEALLQESNSVEQMLRTRMNSYNSIKGNLASIERKQMGNLAVKNLSDVVRKDHFVPDSEYLQTVLVAVPNLPTFLEKYERLTDKVVPRSATKIAEDEDYVLYAVVVFKRVAEEYLNKLRDEKFTPREFVYDEKRIADEKKELSELGSTAKEQSASLLRLCKTNFGEVFSIWLHVKAVRVFVDAILRYGLPPDFQAMLIKPKGKNERKLVELLARHYARLGSSLAASGDDQEDNMEEIQGVTLDKEYFPYVNFDLKWAF